MHCPNCNQHYDSGKFCAECGVPLVEDAPASTAGTAINLGDANAISGGVHLADSHNVHNEDHSVHNITNTTSTVNNITQMAAQKTELEVLQEHKAVYLNACKRAYEDNVLEQHEVVELEELRIKLSLDKATADAILDSVRRMSERNARKTDLNPIARTKLKILTANLQKNEVKALMSQIDSLEPLVRKFDHDELSRKYFLVLAALKSEKCIELYETSMIDNYWKSFWSYLAYVKQGQSGKAENVLISLDRFTDYPDDNMSILAVAGALMAGNTAEAKEYLNELTGEHTPALQRFVDSIYLLLEPEAAKEMGADENTCAFYLVNFFGQKDPKAKAEEERLRQEAEEQAEAKRKAEEEQKAREETENKRKAEQIFKAEQERKKQEAAKLQSLQDEETLRKEYTKFKVLLNDPGPNPIKVKLAASDFVSISEAEDLVDNAPCVFISNVKFKKAKKIKSALEEAGATAVISGDSKTTSPHPNIDPPPTSNDNQVCEHCGYSFQGEICPYCGSRKI